VASVVSILNDGLFLDPRLGRTRASSMCSWNWLKRAIKQDVAYKSKLLRDLPTARSNARQVFPVSGRRRRPAGGCGARQRAGQNGEVRDVAAVAKGEAPDVVHIGIQLRSPPTD